VQSHNNKAQFDTEDTPPSSLLLLYLSVRCAIDEPKLTNNMEARLGAPEPTMTGLVKVSSNSNAVKIKSKFENKRQGEKRQSGGVGLKRMSHREFPLRLY